MYNYKLWIIIGSDRRPETKQGIEGKMIGSDREGLGLGLGSGVDIFWMDGDILLITLPPVPINHATPVSCQSFLTAAQQLLSSKPVINKP